MRFPNLYTQEMDQRCWQTTAKSLEILTNKLQCATFGTLEITSTYFSEIFQQCKQLKALIAAHYYMQRLVNIHSDRRKDTWCAVA